MIDPDDLHPAENIARMRNSTPLTDADRWPWLRAVVEVLADNTNIVLACSALARRYRDLIRSCAPDTYFIHLHGPDTTLAERLRDRKDHFMGATMLDSQLQTLEALDPDEAGVQTDIRFTSDQIDHAHPAGER